MTDKRYNIWLVEVWNDLGAVYNQPIALSYEPEQWFADLFKHTSGDYATIRQFTTNLEETDARCWRKREVETGDYNDNECQALSIKNVGYSGNVPVICVRYPPVVVRCVFGKTKTVWPTTTDYLTCGEFIKKRVYSDYDQPYGHVVRG